MKVGVISDTHDRLPVLDRALELFARAKVEVLVHPGDLIAPFAAKRLLSFTGPRYVVYGNNDGERRGLKQVLPEIQDGPLTVEFDGLRVLVHHFIDWCRPDDIAGADVVITGHTHEVVNETRNGKLFLNPGECCGWLKGKCTVAILDTTARTAEVVEIQP